MNERFVYISIYRYYVEIFEIISHKNVEDMSKTVQ